MALSGATPNDQPLTLLSFRVSSAEAVCAGSKCRAETCEASGGACCAEAWKQAEESAGGGNRTHTGGDPHGILSPARLPVSPLRPVEWNQTLTSVRRTHRSNRECRIECRIFDHSSLSSMP